MLLALLTSAYVITLTVVVVLGYVVVTDLRLLATVQCALLRDLEGTVFDYRLELSFQRDYKLVVRLTTTH